MQEEKVNQGLAPPYQLRIWFAVSNQLKVDEDQQACNRADKKTA